MREPKTKTIVVLSCFECDCEPSEHLFFFSSCYLLLHWVIAVLFILLYFVFVAVVFVALFAYSWVYLPT